MEALPLRLFPAILEDYTPGFLAAKLNGLCTDLKEWREILEAASTDKTPVEIEMLRDQMENYGYGNLPKCNGKPLCPRAAFRKLWRIRDHLKDVERGVMP